MVKRSRRSPLKAESGVRFPLGVPCCRPYGRHFFMFGESHVTRLTLPCNNRYSVAPLLTIPLGGTNCLSFRQAFLLLSAEGSLFRVSADSHATKSFRRPYGRHFCCFLPRVPFLGFRQIPTQQLNPLLCPNIPNISAVKAGFPFLTQSGGQSGSAALSWLAYYSADLTFSISASRCFAAAILS